MYSITQQEKIGIVIAGVLFVLGVWALLGGLFPRASYKAKKIIRKYDAMSKKRVDAGNVIDAECRRISKRLVPFMHLTSIEKAEMEKALQISGESSTPEEYKAYCMTSGLAMSCAGVLVLILGAIAEVSLIRVIGIGLVAYGFLTYVVIKRKLISRQRSVVTGIEVELPRFVAYLATGLRTEDNGVLALLERYTASNERFRDELAQTIGDAKTSSFDGAMARWDQRINSDRLKSVIHGLVCANNGDDVEVYFAMLERDFTAFEIALLKQNVKSIPKRMRLPKALMYSALAIALFYPIIMQILSSFKSIF